MSRSANQPTFVRHIDGAAYGDGKQRIMDEDDALEQAEAEIRRLKQQLSAARELVSWAKNIVKPSSFAADAAYEKWKQQVQECLNA